jgi:zinc/manganese transport system substrate-binding protein
LRAAAAAAGIPAVAVTETLPQGTHYLSWMRDNLANLKAALADG